MLFIRLQHRYCRKLKKCLDQQWNYYKSHNFAPPIKRSKGADFRHDIKKYAVVELGMAIDACGFSREETRKAFMLKWGDVFGFDCHGERGNRTLGDFVFYRCHEFLVLLSKPYKHRA